ncbi:aspartyl protease family protein [Sphingomonas sp. dw_22]|uniref:aspartyl protease family protein n=1 Tax=Sphingomonas sp. dw_22 TaxID=2721175 RepID=UPI001BD2E9FA|nr:aspartyl protease family protein [Sphingomonas sp. dw_22]
MLPLLLALASPAGATATLAPDAEARWVPFELTPNNHVRFSLTIDGKPATAILDTGMTDTMLSDRFAAIAGIRPRQRQRGTAIGGQVAIGWAAGPTLVIGGLTHSGGRIGIAPMETPPEANVVTADMLIGADVLSCCALDIDYPGRRFRILASGRMPFTGFTAPLAHARGRSVWVTELAIAGTRLRPMLIDTGDGTWVSLTRPAWLSTGYRGAQITTTLGYGLGGPSITEAAVIPNATIAGTDTGEIEVRIEDANGYSGRAGLAGRIGSALLMRFRVLFDVRAGRMVLQSAASDAAPYIRSTSGLLMGYAERSLRVLHVMRGSPAAETGWREGDAICVANGTPITDAASAQALSGWTAGPPGTAVRLTLCDGTERTLTLRRFY